MELCVVGKPNVGKTLLLINMAAYLGVRELHIQVADEDMARRSQRLSLERARRDLVSLYAPKTTSVQTISVDAMFGRQRLNFTAVDTVGVTEGIAEDAQLRHQFAIALERVTTADLVMHVVDASSVGTRRIEASGPFDAALAAWGQIRPGYLIVANKMDKPGSLDGLRLMKERYRGVAIVPVSAVTRRGFRELKGWIGRSLA